jgi:hypothetical protein
VSGLAHFFEREGLPTAIICLVRPHAERMKPPRALAVPFELGRPLGAPDEPAFQSRVLRAVLDLLGRRGPGPILEDFPDAPPGGPVDTEGWSCPVNLAPPVENMSDRERLRESFRQEIAALMPWYDESVKAFGRTTVGISGVAPMEIADFLVAILDDPAMASPDPERTIGDYAKLVIDDLRNFYIQSAAAQPGTKTDMEINDWIWGQTVYARVVGEFTRLCESSDDPSLKRLAERALVPLTQRHLVT